MFLHMEFIPFIHKFPGEKKRATRGFIRHLRKQLMHYLASLFCFSGQRDGDDSIFSFGHS